MRKVETPIFLVEKPSNETTATTFNISGIQAQHDQVAMAMHGVTTETRYMYLRSRTQVSCISMVWHNIATEMPILEGNSQKKVARTGTGSVIANKNVRRTCNQVL